MVWLPSLIHWISPSYHFSLHDSWKWSVSSMLPWWTTWILCTRDCLYYGDIEYPFSSQSNYKPMKSDLGALNQMKMHIRCTSCSEQWRFVQSQLWLTSSMEANINDACMMSIFQIKKKIHCLSFCSLEMFFLPERTFTLKILFSHSDHLDTK